MSAIMFAIIKDQNGQELARWPADSLDPDFYAGLHANACGFEIDHAPGLIPDGCEDFSVVLTENPENAAVCWASKNYATAVETE